MVDLDLGHLPPRLAQVRFFLAGATDHLGNIEHRQPECLQGRRQAGQVIDRDADLALVLIDKDGPLGVCLTCPHNGVRSP